MERKKRKFRQSLVFALNGIACGLRSEPHLRVHLVIAALVLLSGWQLRIAPGQWSVLLLCIGLVLISELVNTAVEKTVDLVAPDYHPLAGAAKDLAAGAVLVAVFTAVACGLIILGPPLWARITGLLGG